MPQQRFVTLRTFAYSHEAEIVRSYLESEGVECFLRDETMGQVYSMYSAAIGGIRLEVLEPDAAHAVEVLRAGGYLGPADAAPAREYNPLARLARKLFRLD